MGWIDLYERARQRANVVVLADAAAAGVPERTFRRRVSDEGWPHPHPSVWLLPGARRDHRTMLTATLAHVGPPAVGARRSVLHLHGLLPEPPRPEILVADDRTFRSRAFATVRSRHRRVIEGERRGALCSPELALLQITRVLEDDPLRALLIDARQRRVADLDDLAVLLDRLPNVQGKGRLRPLLDELDVDGSDSIFEHRVRERARARGMQPSSGPHRLMTSTGPVHLDITFPGNVAIECVGYGSHSEREHLDVDVERGNAIALLDEWLVLELTWSRWDRDPDGFLDAVAQAIARRTHS